MAGRHAARIPTRHRRAGGGRAWGRPLTALGVGAAVITAVPGAAYAVWSATGFGSGFGLTGTLSAPTSVSATALSPSAIRIVWSPPTSGAAPTGYRVVRNGSTTPVCTVTAATTSCDDTGLAELTAYSYVVTSTLGSWTADAGQVGATTTSNDKTAPAVAYATTPTTPTSGVFTTSPVGVKLTATDDAGGSGVASITYTVDDAAPVTVQAATASFSVSTEGAHTVTYTATDAAGNTSASVTKTFTIDTVAPTVTVVPEAAATNTSPVRFTVTFSEPVTGFDATDVTLGGTATAATTTKTVTGSGASYVVSVGGLSGNGTVTVQVAAGAATDAAGHPSAAGSGSATYDTVAPTMTDVQGTAATPDGRIDVGDGLRLTFSEAVRPGSILTGWDGTATAIEMRLSNGNGGSSDKLSFSSNGTTLSALGTVDLKQTGYASGNVVFAATARVVDGRTVEITLGSPISGAAFLGTQSNPMSMVWSITTGGALDLAGNKVADGSTVTETGSKDRDF